MIAATMTPSACTGSLQVVRLAGVRHPIVPDRTAFGAAADVKPTAITPEINSVSRHRHLLPSNADYTIPGSAFSSHPERLPSGDQHTFKRVETCRQRGTPFTARRPRPRASGTGGSSRMESQVQL